MVCGQVGQDDGGAVGELGDDADVAAHGVYGLAQSGEQEIAAFFEARDAVLGDAEDFGDAGLSEFAGFAKIAKAHFFSDELGGAGRDPFALRGIESSEFGVHVYRHG